MHRFLFLITLIGSGCLPSVAAVELIHVELEKARDDGQTFVRLVGSEGSLVRYTLDGSPVLKSSGNFLAPISNGDLRGCTLRAREFDTMGKPVGDEKTWSFKSRLTPLKQTVLPVTQNRDYQTYDWANRHAAILELNKKRQPLVVLIGDSITHFWGGAPKMGRITGSQSWEKYLAPRQAANLGYGWDMTQNVLWRLRQGELDGIKPKACVLLIGTNNLQSDSVADIIEGVKAIVAEMRARCPGCKILVLALPRGGLNDPLRKKSVEFAHSLTVAKIADATLNLSDKFIQADGTIPREWMSDLLHPTEMGYEMIGQAVDAQLKDWGI
jgi:lysophospholipase L1-like esterase